MYVLKLLALLLLYVHKIVAPDSRKFIYQKDMSEYCRRRVVPSVFLGRQVVSAYSHVLHFSRLEMPYSCFVSVRTESGSNIILVIQLMSDRSLIDSCRHSKNQLLVYEIGETFGGYWGPLPDNVLKRDHMVPPDHNSMYTLKTTESTSTYAIPSTTRKTTTISTTTKPERDKKTGSGSQHIDYITIEVPIVNVSVHLVPGEPAPTKNIMDLEDIYETVSGPATGSGVSYSSTLLPLVQFSMKGEIPVQRAGGTDYRPRYEMEFNYNKFTPDPRLLLLLSPNDKKLVKLDKKYKYSANRRFNFKKYNQLFTQDDTFNKKKLQPPTFRTQPIAPSLYTKFYNFMATPKPHEAEIDPNSWHVINDILKNLNKTKERATTKIDEHLANLLRGLSRIDTVPSKVFLDSNSSWYTRRMITSRRSELTRRYETDSITWMAPSASYSTNYLDLDDAATVEGLSLNDNKSSNTLRYMNINDSINNNDGTVLLPLALDIDIALLNATNQNNMQRIMNPSMLVSEVSGTTVSTTTPTVIKPLTLLDHESWENMVHAASLMAVVLNQSTPTPRVDDQQVHNVTQINPTTLSRRRRNRNRKKRYIHAIPIENARPHHLPVKPEITTTVHSDKIADAQEFQRLIELQDDEIHDRVALRYLRHYVGPALFNICDFEEASTRYVYLFNSSRLVIALTNFTLDRMTVVMTPARTLLTSEARCGTGNLECQVSGARVCIDSLSACDGVPNCGSYDIYDEDRLMCGASAGLQNNVCLAAITFLAVLLTILYTVHYWLKRCVPKVSDAFFIYTDAAENVLYLDSIMRSPYDTDDGKYYYRGKGMLDYMGDEMVIKKTRASTFFSKLCKRFRRKRRSTRNVDPIDELDHMPPTPPRLYSFGELELNKLAGSVDVAIQTGPSLEINEIVHLRTAERPIDEVTELSDIVAHYEGKRRSTDLRLETVPSVGSELSIIKFLRHSRTVSIADSLQVTFHEDDFYKPEVASKATSNEKEIQTHSFDATDALDPVFPSSSILTINSVTGDRKQDHVQKKLRFEEEPTQYTEREEDGGVEETPGSHRRSVAITSGKNNRNDDTEMFPDATEEPGPANQKEQKSYFWSSNKNKGKKPKKKQLSTLKHS